MQRYVRAGLILLASVCCFPATALSVENDASIESFYHSLRDELYADYQRFVDMAKAERQRKMREKLPALTDKESSEGTSAIKFLLYNKAIFFVLCAESADRSDLPEQGVAAVKQCVSAKTADMMRYLKLNDHPETFGNRRLVSCAIKARNFQREASFPPFEFLRDPKGPEIIDFPTAINCITAGQ